MMIKRLCAVLLLLAAFAAQAQTTLVDKGDFSTDPSSNLDWLKLSKVNGLSFSAVASGALGYTTSGWRFANQNELLNLFTTQIGPQNYQYVPEWLNHPNAGDISYFKNAEDLVVKLGMNVAFSDNRASYNLNVYPTLHQITIQGLYDGGLAEASAVYPGGFYPGDLETPISAYGRWYIGPGRSTSSGPSVSSFLVRESIVSSVPEPSMYIMMFAGLCVIGWVSLCRRSFQG